MNFIRENRAFLIVATVITVLSLAKIGSAHAAEPLIIQAKGSAEQIMAAANVAIKSPSKRIAGNSATFVALVPIKVDMGAFLPNTYPDMQLDMSVVAKDGKFKIESSNPSINGRTCIEGKIQEDHIPACEKGIVGMQSHIANLILSQLEKNAF